MKAAERLKSRLASKCEMCFLLFVLSLYVQLIVIAVEVSSQLLAWLKFRQAEGLDLDRSGIKEIEDMKDSRRWAKPRQVVRRSDLNFQTYQEEFEGQLPVVLENAYEKMPCTKEGWVEASLIKPFKNERVVFLAHQSNAKDHEDRTMTAKLSTFVKNVNKNLQNAWSYLQDDFFLQRHPDLIASCPPLPPFLKGNQFELMPEVLRPPNVTLLWGGRYSRSKLHVDRYNWTGTNVILRGEKFIRLIPPGGHDQHLEAIPTNQSFRHMLHVIVYEFFFPFQWLSRGFKDVHGSEGRRGFKIFEFSNG